MITLDELKDNYIIPVLEGTPFKFSIFTDTGDYEKAKRRKNTVTEYINGLFKLVESEIKKIGGGLTAVALVTNLKFLIPCGDETEVNGEFAKVTEFRNALSEVFSQNQKINITSEGQTYVGGVAYSLPMAGEREIRQRVGDSIAYTCSITFAYLENAVNASDVSFTLDDEIIPYTSFTIRRAPSISAALYAGTSNGESKAYAEMTGFTVDLEMPVLSDSPPSAAVAAYLLGTASANAVHTLKAIFAGLGEKTYSVIFGECYVSGAGVSNCVYKLTFLPAALEAMES